MKKTISLFLAVFMLLALCSCSQKYQLKSLELTDEMLDISSMGMLDNIFTSENRDKLVNIEPEHQEYYTESYVDGVYEREDLTVLNKYHQILADDPNFYIKKTFYSDYADGRICQVGLSCQVQIPTGEYSDEEMKAVFTKTMDDALAFFTEKFSLLQEPDSKLNIDKDRGCMYHWMDDEYVYSFSCTYVGGVGGDNDLCRVTVGISSRAFTEKYHGE